MKQIEKRSFEFRVADAADASPKLEGHAAVFNEEADIAGLFLERVAPGAFAESITKDDVRALFNHDPNFVLGRSIAKTLELKEDEKGLAISIVPPDTQFAKDLVVSMRRGDISQMSFGFQVLGFGNQPKSQVLSPKSQPQTSDEFCGQADLWRQ